MSIKVYLPNYQNCFLLCNRYFSLIEIDISGCKTTNVGSEYDGGVSKTKSGYTCQRWDKQVPHKHTRTNPNTFPEETLADAANFCRNPDNAPGGPWCYTTDPGKRWEYCDIKLCPTTPAPPTTPSPGKI